MLSKAEGILIAGLIFVSFFPNSGCKPKEAVIAVRGLLAEWLSHGLDSVEDR